MQSRLHHLNGTEHLPYGRAPTSSRPVAVVETKPRPLCRLDQDRASGLSRPSLGLACGRSGGTARLHEKVVVVADAVVAAVVATVTNHNRGSAKASPTAVAPVNLQVARKQGLKGFPLCLQLRLCLRSRLGK